MKSHTPPKILSALAAVVLFLLLGPFNERAIATPGLVQTAAALNDASAATISQTFAANNVAGHLIVVAASWGTRSATPAVTDSLGNLYTLAVTSYSSSGDQSLAIYYSKNIRAGANTVTVNLGGSHAWRRILVAEYSGINPNNPLDVVAVNQGSATTAADNVTSGSATTSSAGDLIFGAVENFNVDGAVAAGSGFTLRNSLKYNGIIETAIEDRNQGAAGPVSATFTFAHADAYLAEMVAFKASSNADVTSPSVPANLTASSISASQINLSWTASTDNVAVAGYQIFRNSSQIATSTAPSYSDTGLTAATAYTYTVAAFDAAGNVSAQSTSATATTQSSPAAPVISAFSAVPLSIIAGQTSMLLWSVSGNPAPALSIDQGVGTVTGTLTIVSPAATTIYTLTAINASGTRTAQATVSVGSVPDTTPPSIPANLTASSISASQINLSWTASTDNVAVAGYHIFRNGSQIATSTVPSYSDAGLTPATAYAYAVAAVDTAGNVSAQSSPASAATQGLPPGPPYPIKFSTDHTHLVDQNNQPFFIVGDSATSLIVQLSNADVDTYLADRAAKGFNTIWVELIEHQFAANPPADVFGDQPFTTPGNFATPNEAYFQHADFVIREAARYGIMVLLTPAYVGYNCGSQGWCAEMQAASDTEMTAWGQYVGNRYKNFTNIMWLIGGDADPTQYAGLQNKLNDVATGIKSADTNHLMTAHNVRGESALDIWSGYPWLDLNDIYNLPQDIHAKANHEYLRPDFLPFFLVESYYEGEHSMTPLQLRTEGYEAILSGACLGYIFGNYAIWDFSAPGVTTDPWQGQLNSEGSVEQSYLGALFRSRENWKLVPDTNNSVMTAGAQSGTTLAVDARTSDGQSIIAYIPTQRSITIDMTKISDVSANAWWFNPQTASSILAGTFPTTGTRNFTSPDQNDWVLVIDSASVNLPAPGSSVYVSSPDTSPPSIPANLTATSISASQINLSWTASTDNVAVAGYQIIRNGSQFATSTVPSYSDTGLTAATAYTYAVAAFDAAGNVSGQSAGATATTAPASDSTAPAIISNTTTIVWTTDEPATSQVEYGTTLAYGSNNPLDPTLLTSHSVVLTGLVPQTLYNYRIHSSDAAGNEKISANGQFMMVGSN